MSFRIAPSTSPGTGPARDDDVFPAPLTPAAIEVRVDELLATLEREADHRVGQRRPIEQRWVRESYQYHGKYLEEEEKAIRAVSTIHRSSVYMNETRRRTDFIVNRLVDTVFTVDDRNFSTSPTSVPELADEAKAWARFASENQQMLLQVQDGAPEADEAIEAQREALMRATETQAVMDEARRRSELMQAEMEDQLQECSYNHQCRLAIHDAFKLGTGILKGPVLSTKTHKSWSKRTDEQSGFQVHEMLEVEKPRPAFYRVDPYNWFPVMEATKLSESDSFFERHLLTRSGLRKLAKVPGFIQDNIRKLLKEKPRGTNPHYISELRNIAEDGASASTGERYHVWEYHGPIDLEDMHCVAAYTEDDELARYADEIDPLQEINITVWFCQGTLLKFGVHPLDSGEPIYSVLNYKSDDHSIFGFGIPHLLAPHQQVLCAAWRMMVDNANLATLPQIVFNPSVVEPEDGDPVAYPGKTWIKRSGTAPGEKPFETFHFDIRQVEMRSIIEMTLQAMDREIGIPTIAEAEPGVIPVQTNFGVSVFNSDTKIPIRAQVKNFDDNITYPNMQRLFDWNMQFSEREDIKGDMRIRARGVSTFMLRELQVPALMTMLVQFASHPVLGPALKIMPMVRMVAQAMLLPQHEVVKSDEQMAADLAAAAQNQPEEPSPEQIKLQIAEMNYKAAVEQAQINAQSRKYEIDRQYEIEVLRQEGDMNKNLDTNASRERIKDMDRESGERKMAADIGMAEKTNRPSGGYV